jgi:hypothetical protein
MIEFRVPGSLVAFSLHALAKFGEQGIIELVGIENVQISGKSPSFRHPKQARLALETTRFLAAFRSGNGRLVGSPHGQRMKKRLLYWIF